LDGGLDGIELVLVAAACGATPLLLSELDADVMDLEGCSSMSSPTSSQSLSAFSSWMVYVGYMEDVSICLMCVFFRGRRIDGFVSFVAVVVLLLLLLSRDVGSFD
jgi:hypothetical protein